MTGVTRGGVARGTGELPTGGCVSAGPTDPDLGRGWAGHRKPQSAGLVSGSQGPQAGLCNYCTGLSTAAPSIASQPPMQPMWSCKHPHPGFSSPYSTGSAPQITALLCDHEIHLQKGQQVAREHLGNQVLPGRRQEGVTPHRRGDWDR